MNILFPTDFSTQSADAFELALFFAKKSNSRITLLHVFQLPVITTGLEDGTIDTMPDELIQISEQAARNRLSQFKDELKLRYNSGYGEAIPVDEVLRMGFVADEIIAISEDIETLCIVLPVAHSKKVDRFIMGGVVSAVLKKSACPVLTVPPEYRFKEIKRIGYATDLAFGDNAVINSLLLVAEYLDAELRCFHVHDSNLDIENSIIQDFITQYSTDVKKNRISFQLIENLNIEDGIDFFVKENDIDLLGMLKQKSYWLTFFDVSYTKKMAFHSKIPLLVYQE